MNPTKRIILLSEAEKNDLYALPIFDDNDRDIVFDFTKDEINAAGHYSTTKTKCYFYLQLVYFKAKQQFFDFTFQDASSDVKYLINNYKFNFDIIPDGKINRHTLNEQRQRILSLFNYSDWSNSSEAKITEHVCKIIRLNPQEHGALRLLLDYFNSINLVIPSYRALQDIFTAAYRVESIRMTEIICEIPMDIQHNLFCIIKSDDGVSHLSIVRADQKDFLFTSVRTEVEKAKQISDLYTFSKSFLPKLGLSKNAIQYYADHLEQYPIARLRKLSKNLQLIYTICFIYYRYQQIIDNLIASFIYHVNYLLDSANAYADSEMLKHSSNAIIELPKLANFLKWFPERDVKLDYKQINDLAYEFLPKKQFSELATFLEGNSFDKKKAKWQYFAQSSRYFALYLRPILLNVNFENISKNSNVSILVDSIKKHYISGKNAATFKFSDDLGLTIPKNMSKFLKQNEEDEFFDPYLVEFYVYKKVHHLLKRGKIFCNDSISYCDIECDLVSEELVEDIDKISHELGFPKIPVYCDERLDIAIKKLKSAWLRTTTRIDSGLNPGFQLPSKDDDPTAWSLIYDSSEPLDDSFFRKLPKIEIADIIMFIGEITGMWDTFTHFIAVPNNLFITISA